MTIFGNLLARGYFPKELPPAFFTDEFSRYARTVAGRQHIETYSPPERRTDTVRYRLAQPGRHGLGFRSLAIPHPWAFAKTAVEVSKHFRRLLKRAGRSKISKSRPVYATGMPRAMRTLVRPSNLGRERAHTRAASTHLLKVDVSQFYPSLYTHAVGWSVDPKLRQKAHWKNTKLLGKRLDQLLMDGQGKVSQGIPIGSDISFLLAEVVLAEVDRQLKIEAARGFRWFDDYEFACGSRQEAEQVLSQLTALLDSFRLRINPLKTKILDLPVPAGDGWQDELRQSARNALFSPSTMTAHFDRAFRLRLKYEDEPVLLYAMGTLFRTKAPAPEVLRVAESCVTQALLAEPGCAQKAFALTTFWELNGSPFSRPLFVDAIDQLIGLHHHRGVSSDVAWALAFGIEHGLKLPRSASRSLAKVDDDAVMILSLHAHALGLTQGFSPKALAGYLLDSDCEGGHWLALYEVARRNWVPGIKAKVAADPFFGPLLSTNVAFYRERLPTYASVVHPGGAPEWVVASWIQPPAEAAPSEMPIAKLITNDLSQLNTAGKTVPDLAVELVDRLTEHPTEGWEPYS